MIDVANDLVNIEKIIEEGNKKFIEIVKTDAEDEKLMLKFFREKYTHFILYRLLQKHGRNVITEGKTELKFSRTGQTPKSGNHDLVVLDESNQPFAGFEFFLGYVVGDISPFTDDSIKQHLYLDYQKLTKSNLKAVYLLNYFYKGRSPRSSPGYETKLEETYQSRLSNVVTECKELAKKHKESNSKMKLGIWIVEARNDGLPGMGIKRIS